MKYVYYITFISIVVVIGWIFRPVEHMSTGTCKRRIWGPKGMDGKNYPEVYGPDGIGRNASGPDDVGGAASGPGGAGGTSSRPRGIRPGRRGVAGEGSGQGGVVDEEDQDNVGGEQAAMYEDDGEFSSNTATRNAAYMNVFTFKPYAKTNFPVSGPPEPYLSDFANFHR
jgi:hypothetical protein